MKNLAILLFSLCFLLSVQSSFAQCSILGPDAFTEGETENYSVLTAIGGGSYFWSVTGDLTLIGNNNSASVTVGGNDPGEGTVCVTIFKAGEEPCCDCKEVTIEEEIIDPPCIPATSISVSQIEISGNGCPGDIIEFEADIQPSNATGGTYFWEAGTDFVISNPFFQQTTTSSTVFIDTPDGENSVWVRVTFRSCDGTTVTALTLVIWEFWCFKGPGPFRGGSLNTTIAPNPFSDYTQFSFEAPQEMDVEVEIFNINGQIVATQAARFFKGKNDVRFDNLPSSTKGILYYRVKSEDAILDFGELLRID